MRGISRWPVNSPHKGPVTRKMFPFDDVIMMWLYIKQSNNTAVTYESDVSNSTGQSTLQFHVVHYSDTLYYMNVMASQTTGESIVYSSLLCSLTAKETSQLIITGPLLGKSVSRRWSLAHCEWNPPPTHTPNTHRHPHPRWIPLIKGL